MKVGFECKTQHNTYMYIMFGVSFLVKICIPSGIQESATKNHAAGATLFFRAPEVSLRLCGRSTYPASSRRSPSRRAPTEARDKANEKRTGLFTTDETHRLKRDCLKTCVSSFLGSIKLPAGGCTIVRPHFSRGGASFFFKAEFSAPQLLDRCSSRT